VVPAMSADGRTCVKIDLQGCPGDYAKRLEKLVQENSDRLEIRIRGIDYYVELLVGHSLPDALTKTKP
jgi:hypothetical protein